MNVGEKFSVQLGNYEGEIMGIYPVGQTVPISINGGAYQIMVNGFRGIIAKNLFDAIFKQSAIPVVEEAKEVAVKHKKRKKEEVIQDGN